MKTEKMNSFGDLVKNCSRFKPFSDRNERKNPDEPHTGDSGNTCIPEPPQRECPH
jgi:hypothetical protein